jgi:hypothetical protein
MTTPAGSTDDEYGGVRDSVGAVVDEAVSKSLKKATSSIEVRQVLPIAKPKYR